MRIILFLAAVIGGALVGSQLAPADAGTVAASFTNNTGQPANDLHLEWYQAVTWTPALPAPFTTASAQGQANVDFSGAAVANGGVVNVTFTSSGSGPTLKRGWWTNNGTNIGALTAANSDPDPRF